MVLGFQQIFEDEPALLCHAHAFLVVVFLKELANAVGVAVASGGPGWEVNQFVHCGLL
jgi:hypothetical protein